MKYIKTTVIVCFALLICAFYFGDNIKPRTSIHNTYKANTTVKADIKLQVQEISLEDILPPISNSQYIEGAVIDYSGSLKEMKQKSDIIVIGRVTNHEQPKALGIKSTISITEVLKGKVTLSNISILQLNDNSVVQQGREYTLFLGKQDDGTPDTYFVKGGTQGIFLHENGILINRDKTINDELQTMIRTNKGISEYDILRNFIKN